MHTIIGRAVASDARWLLLSGLLTTGTNLYTWMLFDVFQLMIWPGCSTRCTGFLPCIAGAVRW